MKYTEALGRSVLSAFGGLLLGGYLGSLLFTLALVAIDHAPFINWLLAPALAFGVFLYALIIAAPTTFVVGWPAYSLLLYLDKASYSWSAAIPILLSVVALITGESELAGLTLLYGLAIAWVTHALQMRAKSRF